MPVTRLIEQWPNAVLLPGPGRSSATSLSRKPFTTFLAYVITVPTSIASTLDSVMVQMSPARPR